MDNSNISNERFAEMVKKASPNSSTFSNCVKAFLVGGFICVIGQIFTMWYERLGMAQDVAGSLSAISLMLIAIILTGLGVFDNIAGFGGAGATVPITGFANSIASAAIEFKKEGFIFGVGAKIFVIAGPVIVYGLAASTAMGIFYYFLGR